MSRLHAVCQPFVNRIYDDDDVRVRNFPRKLARILVHEGIGRDAAPERHTATCL